MTSPTLLSLAGRVEQLTGPCREMDREILFAIFPKDRVAIFDGVKHISTMTGRGGEPWFLPLADRDDCPRYTASLDAAMTLVPEGWPITDFSYWPSVPAGYESERCSRLTITDLSHDGFGGRNRFKGQALTPALALTAASLHARSALEGES